MYKIITFNKDNERYVAFTNVESFKFIKDGVEFEIDGKKGVLMGSAKIAVVPSEQDISNLSDEELLIDAMIFNKNYIIERLSEECETTIKQGFYSQRMNCYFGFSDKDQLNFNQQLSLVIMDINNEVTEIAWKSEDKGVLLLSKEDFLAVCKEGEKHKRFHISMFWKIKNKITEMNNIEDILQVGSYWDELQKIQEDPQIV